MALRRVRGRPVVPSCLAPVLAELADLKVVGGLIRNCCLTLPDVAVARSLGYLAGQVIGHAERGLSAIETATCDKKK